MQALDFSLSHSLPELYSCSWKLMWLFSTNTCLSHSRKHPDITELEHWACHFKCSLTSWGAEPCRVNTHRAPDSAKRGIPKVVCTNICTHFGFDSCLSTRECLISHRRLSGRCCSYTFPPSVSRNGASVVASSAALMEETLMCLLDWVNVCGVHPQLPDWSDWWCYFRRYSCTFGKS